MSAAYELLPVVFFLLGVVFGLLFSREHLLRLRAERNLERYRADRNRAERDLVLARVAQLTDGGRYKPHPMPEAWKQHLRTVPKQGER